MSRSKDSRNEKGYYSVRHVRERCIRKDLSDDPASPQICGKDVRSSSAGQLSALNYAYKLLSYRDRSEKEMTERLRMKGFDERKTADTIECLKSNGFLNERRLASSLMRSAREQKQLSARGARKFLMERGLKRDIIDEKVCDIDETETAKKLIKKKLSGMNKTNPIQNKLITDIIAKKFYSLLLRRGFSSQTISMVLRQFKIKEEIE